MCAYIMNNIYCAYELHRGRYRGGILTFEKVTYTQMCFNGNTDVYINITVRY